MTEQDNEKRLSQIERVKQLLLLSPILARRFELVKTLGGGAAGVVFHVRDRTQDNKDFALKVLVNDSAFDENTLKRFFRELQILRDIRHPNLIEAYDFIAMDELTAFTMEYIRGSDLGKLARSASLTTEQIDHIFQSILSALHQLHQNGIAHRDLKLENVLISENGVVKLTDLGIVKQLSHRGSTQTGLLLGTTPYLPPEYVKYNQYHLRGDIYAVGLMLYECLTGQRWMQRKQTTDAIQTIGDENFEFPKLALTGLAWKYRNILTRALAIDPDDRYPSAEDMRQALSTSTGDPEKSDSIALRQHIDLSDFTARSIAAKPASSALMSRTVLFILMTLAGLMLSLAVVTQGKVGIQSLIGLLKPPPAPTATAVIATEPDKPHRSLAPKPKRTCPRGQTWREGACRSAAAK